MSVKTKYFQNCLGVFQGGGVKAIAFAGAYEEAIRRGVFFSQLIGTSAGSIIAVLIGAGATPDQLNEILGRLDFELFLSPPVELKNVKYDKRIGLFPNWLHPDLKTIKKYVRYLGEYNASYISVWLDDELRKLLGRGSPVRFKDLYIPTSVVTTDIKNKRVKVWDGDNDAEAEVALAVQTSCSIPFYFQPYDMQFVDGGLLSNLPSFKLRPGTIFDKILAFSFSNETGQMDIDGLKTYFRNVMEAAIDGAVDLQLQMQSNIHLIRINTGEIQSTDFDKIDEQKKKFLLENGKKAAKKFFDGEDHNIQEVPKKEDVAKDIFETFNFLVRTQYNLPAEVLVCHDLTNWVYSLFPTLLKWKNANASVFVLLKKNTENEEDRAYKIRLLRSLGFGVQETIEIPFKGFLFDSSSSYASAVVLNENDLSKANSKFYTVEDFSAIKVLAERFKQLIGSTEREPSKIEVKEIDQEKLFNLLRKVKQYSGVSTRFEIKRVNVGDLTFLTKFNKGYKFRQVETIFEIYKEWGIELFKPAELKFGNGLSSIITPPIIEEYEDGTQIVIEGNARLTYGFKNGNHDLYCVVVKNIAGTIPSDGRFNAHQILITDLDKTGKERYLNFKGDQFRRIEAEVHNVKTSLI